MAYRRSPSAADSQLRSQPLPVSSLHPALAWPI
jgi:hypothetical protein